ncbi:hypothetical protein J2I47_18540 [Fibrella sp. HMF5335]|uniref:Uncharacterized protein n=1 Tax=Fibrella rubiginis TaxID=2817060 RepID=A0A939K2U3_9BACT|nr:hypothetical protein [Fibrella rubiginis]
MSAQQRPIETRRFAIDIAGARIGSMTVTRQLMPGNEVIYTQISDVRVNFLIYKVKVYYKVVSLFRQGQMINATVDAQTNKGNYASRTVWKGDHYDIEANQYKYTRKSTEPRKIDYTVTMLYFSEPTGKQRVYAEYFGDYFNLTSALRSDYKARLDDREDEYIYEKGRLVKVIKKNALKNFVIRPLD